MSLPSEAYAEDAKAAEAAVHSAIESFESDLTLLFSEDEIKKIRAVGSFLVTGMALEESALLARLNPDEFKKKIEEVPALKAFILLKETTFKARLMNVMTRSAIDGRTKEAMFLLEQRFPHEFNRKATNPEEDHGDKDDLIRQGIDHVRQNGDSEPLVRSTPV